ncbi:EAL domain-containing protein [Rhodocyclus tenuis]|uniref:putative bifunctional diguanylate cyclase/phosphodiesterase n=1 Tax=Rhodocyclus gracilis TaxID=2929842 RepID=UPI0012989DE0|nr:EAL domain-containing protein [Rhodocyclus gracilis]MRD73026.1 EAL domain-containing protein [Rhodocyclus gracilis]
MGELPYSSLDFAGVAQEPVQRILIVDDEARLRDSYRELLAGRAEIVECADGREAMARLDSDTFDVVLLDIRLPDISGLAVLQWARQRAISAIVIMVSADPDIDSAIDALRGGAGEFVRKPCDPELLLRAVERALQRRRLERSHALLAARLEQSERLHRFLVEQAPDIIYTLDEAGRFVFVNGRVESLLGFCREELVGQPYTELVHEEDRERARYAFAERRTGGRASANVEIRLRCKNDEVVHVDNRFIVAMLSATGIYETEMPRDALRFMGTYGIARDITERKRAEEKISFQAFHDLLTQLPNRVLFRDRLALALSQAARRATLLGVMFIDLDRFKTVNDSFGHAEGDQLLKTVAQRLKHCLRAGDTLARLGGDEFTVMLPDLLHADDVVGVAEKIAQELGAPLMLGGQEFRPTASIGIAVFPRDGETVEALIAHADLAMYQVKNAGKNSFGFYSPHMSEARRERLSLENDLQLAIERREFVLHYQPQFSQRSGQMIGMEALLRWQHPRLGLLAPGGFIALAEETGLICRISDWVLQEGCRQLALWHADGHRHLRLALNLSARDFERKDLLERVVAAPARHGIGCDRLEIEITESLLLDDAEDVIATVRQLRQHGVRVAIDDFGMRYSSLNYLRRFPVSSIKIDQSFVRDLGRDQGAASIIHAIVGIAEGFGLHLIAEGVESEEQARRLADLGCEDMQGYYFGRPLPADEVLEWATP